ncbi:AAA family ATPase [Bacillus cereus group sp. Bce009]|uniref:AAA family ATPase n=1 Tax=Bacillus cereus group sp. Bce009 TaxID=3445252 RepID=UPI003F27382B
MFKISYLYIKNFRGDQELKLKFPDSNVITMHGSNGCGKTTLLRIIHGILDFNTSILQSENINNATLIFTDTQTHLYNHLTVNYSEESKQYTYSHDFPDENFLLEKFSSIVFGVNRGITNNISINKVTPLDIHKMMRRFNLQSNDEMISQSEFLTHGIEEAAEFINHQVYMRARRIRRNKSEIDFDKKHIMLDNLSMKHVEDILTSKYLAEERDISERVQKALFETLAQVLDSQNNKEKYVEINNEEFFIKLSLYRDTLLEILDELEENELSKKLIRILKRYKPELKEENILLNMRLFKDKELMSLLIHNMIIELEKGKVILNSVTQLIEEFNTYLTANKKLIIDEHGPRIVTKNSIHSLEKLSSGERHLLSFLTIFIIEGQHRNILMIDEPEISLNLEWQSKLLKLFRYFAPNSQIIVATHSPAIAAYDTGSMMEIKG